MSLFQPSRMVSPFLGTFTIRSLYHHHPHHNQPLLILRLKSTYSTVTSTTLRPSQPFNTILNPPSTTRPPPLKVPARGSNQGKFAFYFSLAKTYLTFYKTALGHIRSNWKEERTIKKRIKEQAKEVNKAIKQQQVTVEEAWELGNRGPQMTRAELQLMRRSARDKRRLPLFLGLFLATFEFFPLVVYVFSKQLASKLPAPVLQPNQEESLRLQTASRWKKAEEKWGQVQPEQFEQYVGYMADFHGLTPSWIPGALVPKAVLAARVNRHVEYLRYDDQLLGKDSIQGLVDEEVVIAAVERGLWEEGAKIETLRKRLQENVNKSWEMERELEKEMAKGSRRRS
jgi:hypothetical protein